MVSGGGLVIPGHEIKVFFQPDYGHLMPVRTKLFVAGLQNSLHGLLSPKGKERS